MKPWEEAMQKFMVELMRDVIDQIVFSMKKRNQERITIDELILAKEKLNEVEFYSREFGP